MARDIPLQPISQGGNERPLACDCQLRCFEALVAVADLALAGVQISLRTGQSCLQGSDLSDQVERHPRQVKRGVSLMDASADLGEFHASAE